MNAVLRASRFFLIPLLVAGADWAPDPTGVRDAVSATRVTLGARRQSVRMEPDAPRPGPDAAGRVDSDVEVDLFAPPKTSEEGPAMRRVRAPTPSAQGYQGFQALGPAGSRGSIDGPYSRGNGRFETLANDAWSMKLKVQTGYVDGIVHLYRDGAGQDWLAFNGRLSSPSSDWRRVEQALAVRVEYDGGRDSGVFRYSVNGSGKSEQYWGGASGKDMTMELGGGWDHDFLRE